MNDKSLYTKINALPGNLKMEVVDYMEYLMQKHHVKEKEKHPQPGCMKGTFIMHDDFDTPLDDFKEYMQ